MGTVVSGLLSSELFQAAVAVLVASLVATRWGAVPARAEGAVLRYSTSARMGAMLLGVLPPYVLVAFAWYAPPKDDGGWIAWGVALAACLFMAALGVIETLFVALVLDGRGVERRTPWRRRVFVPWKDVVRVHRGVLPGWLVLTSRTGETVRVHRWLCGDGMAEAYLSAASAPARE